MIAECALLMKRCFFLFAFAGLCCHALSQQDELNFVNFSSKNGLSSNSVLAIVKDRYGYMWFATEDGLNKFDGANFTVYTHNPRDTTTIGAGTISSLREDRNGNLWLGAGNTLSRYDREKDAFVNIFLPGAVIRSICDDRFGNMWIGTYAGLYILNPKTGKIRKIELKTGHRNELLADAIVSILEDSRGHIWIGTNSGLYRTDSSNGEYTCFLPRANDPLSYPDVTTRVIIEDAKRRIWFGTKESGLSMLLPDGRSFKTYRHSETDVQSISSDRIFALAADNNGKLWVGTEDGLDIFDPQTGSAFRIGHDQRRRYSFIGKSIRSIYLGSDGIVWIGTFRAGVNKYDKNLEFFNLRQSNAFDPWGLSSSTVTSFVEAADGDIYMGTDGGGLNLFHRKTGLFDHPSLSPDGKQTQSILAMAMADKDLWISTYPNGIIVLNTVTGAKRHYRQGNGDRNLTSNEIFCIRKDSHSNIWVGTNGNGVSVFDPRAGTFRRFDPNDPSASEATIPSNGFIRSIVEDRNGNVWIASYGTGIALYDPGRNVFRHLNHDNSSLPYDFVMSMHAASDGSIWVGTAGKGLGRYDFNTGQSTAYGEPEGLANGFVYEILEDDAGVLWVSTNKGISSFDPKAKKFRNYTYYNGLQQGSYCGGAGIKTSAGEMFFGGLDGFNYFDPRTFHPNKQVPLLVLTDLKIANRSVIPGNNAAIRQHVSVAKEIRLNYRQNFSLDFVALNYSAPEENRYAYKLDGFDRNWNDVGTSKTAVYTNLAPGSYLFRLKAHSEDGSWTTPETTIRIYVKPPLWRTTYAYIFYVAAAAFLVWLIRHRGITKAKDRFAQEQERQQFRRMLEEERKEAERKQELNQLKIKFLTNLSHEFRTPVSLIVSPAEQLMEQESSDEKRQKLGLIKRNARRLLNLVNQLLDFRKLEESELKLNVTENDLVEFSRDVAESFKDISDRKHIEFSFSSSVSSYFTAFDKDKLERILFNLLSNAFKFTRENGKIWLKIEPNPPSGVKIIVADTGIGIDEDARDKVFDRFFQADTDNAILNQGNGIGLSITREFVKLHGGSIDVESIPGKGSAFTINFPFKPVFRIVKELGGTNAPSITGSPETEVDQMTMADETNKPVVLLVDDHEDFLDYLSSNLRPYYRVEEASDGKKAWQKALSSHPQVIVSDINMPEMDGISLCKKIRSDKRTQHIPIILLTALTGDSNQLKGLDTGANDYLTKPFNFQILNVKIKNLLNLNQTLKNVYSRQFKLSTPDVEVLSEDEKLLRAVMEYIDKYLDSPELSVEELARHVGMSRGALYNRIVALTGETPVEFIRSVKLDKAAALLENTDMKISQVGYAVGFTAPNYFAKVFKEKFDLSPSEYIKLKRKPG
jgi:signal transduction histidine kinase/ligand-binding sensor domain-containing protein/DNA-binding response OmpR family regulator